MAETGKKRHKEGYGPTDNAHYVMFSHPTRDTPGTSLYLQFPNKRYILGNIAEGAQRALHQGTSAKMRGLTDIFLTGTADWSKLGGLMGFLLSLGEVGKISPGFAGSPTSPVSVYGPGNLNYILATMRRFILRQTVSLNVREVPALKVMDTAKRLGTAASIFEDSNIEVWALAAPPGPPAPNSESWDSWKIKDKKRKQDDMEREHDTNLPREVLPRFVGPSREINGIVESMFSVADKKTGAEGRLFRCMLSDATPGSTVFVRNEERTLVVYQGAIPSPGEEGDVEAFMPTARRPESIMNIPACTRNLEAISYIIRTKPMRGTFLVEKARAMGITDHRVFRPLIDEGKSIVNDDGMTITPEMLMAPPVPSRGYVVAELPTVDYVEPFLDHWNRCGPDLRSNMKAYCWILGPGVADHPSLLTFMKRQPNSEHIVSAPDVCADRFIYEKAASTMSWLHEIDPKRFNLPDIVPKAAPPLPDRAIVAALGLVQPVHGILLKASLDLAREIVPHKDLEALSPYPASANAAKAAREAIENSATELAEWAKDIPQPDTEIITLGTGSSSPSLTRNVSGTLVRVPGFGNVLLDAGEGTLGQIRRAFAGDEYTQLFADLKIIYISHPHADHHLGMTSIIKEWHRLVPDVPAADGSKPQLTVLCEHGMLKWLHEYSAVEDIGWDRLRPLRILAIERPSQRARTRVRTTTSLIAFDPKTKHFDYEDAIPPSALGLADFQAVDTTHCNASMAASFTWPSGLKVSYSGDCRPTPAFVDIGRDSTLLIHEATFEPELRRDAFQKQHSTTAEAIDIAKDMGAKTLLLTHFSQRYSRFPVMSGLGAQAGAVRTPGTLQVKGAGDLKIGMAFDFMRVKVGEMAELERFFPAMAALMEAYENAKAETKRANKAVGVGKGKGTGKGKGVEDVTVVDAEEEEDDDDDDDDEGEDEEMGIELGDEPDTFGESKADARTGRGPV